MDNRKQMILRAVVMDYIATAEPVGSRTIARKYNLGVSPATIRNEMSDLEELGLIEQPHTSSGRIPSDLGYRYYVDCLMEKEHLTDAVKGSIYHNLNIKIKEIDGMISDTSRLLSELTNLTVFIQGPSLGANALERIEIIPMRPQKALVVVIGSTGSVENRIIDIPGGVTEQDLRRVSYVLNQKLHGINMEQVRYSVLRELHSELTRQKDVLTQILDLLEETLQAGAEERVYLGGTLNILNQPEFKDVEKIKSLLGIMEEERFLRSVLARAPVKGIGVKIGGENQQREINDCSIITATYKFNGEVIGTVGILGPTRMNYSKTMSAVEFFTETLSNILGKIYTV